MATTISFMIGASSIATFIAVHLSFKFGDATQDRPLLERIVSRLARPFGFSTVYTLLYGGVTYFISPIQGMAIESELLAIVLGLLAFLPFMTGIQNVLLFAPSRDQQTYLLFVSQSKMPIVMQKILTNVYCHCYLMETNTEHKKMMEDYLVKTTLSSQGT